RARKENRRDLAGGTRSGTGGNPRQFFRRRRPLTATDPRAQQTPRELAHPLFDHRSFPVPDHQLAGPVSSKHHLRRKGTGMGIAEQHLKHWLEHGYAVVDDFLTPEELAAAQSEFSRTFPSREEYAYAPTLYRNDARGGHMRELPFLGDALNLMAVHPEIVSFVERALGTPRITLAQSLAWAKYPGFDDFNMPLHVDYMNTSMLYPNAQGPHEEVTFILYYVDVDQQLGATYVVSKQHSRNEVLVPYAREKSRYPDLYR